MYEKIKNMPVSRDGKMLFGMAAAFMAREMLDQGLQIFSENPDGAFFAFILCGVMMFTLGLSIARYDNGRPLFEPIMVKR